MAQFTYLQGLTFSFTNVEILPLRDELERKILKLGGKYLKDFSTTLTSHLITTAPNGAKYLKAMEIKIPCLLPTFIDECWMKAHLSHHSSMNGDLPNLIKRHLIPPFYRLRITLTGFTSQERKDLSLGIIGAGGTYSPELRIETTHLIMQDNPMPSRRSPKLEYAKKWNIPIIKGSYWLMESIRKGFCLGIDDSFLYCPSSLIMVDMNDDPLSSNNMSKIPSPSIIGDELTLEDIEVMSSNNELNDLSYFAQMHFYLPPTSKKISLLRKLILIAGGTRHANLSYDQDMITHWIVCDQTISPSDLPMLENLRSTNSKVIFVHDEYLFACLSSRSLISPSDYLIDINRFTEVKDNDYGIEDSSLTIPTTTKRKAFGSFNVDISESIVAIPPKNNMQPNNVKKSKIQLESIRPPPPPSAPLDQVQSLQQQFPGVKHLIFKDKSFIFKYFENEFHKSELSDLLESNGATILSDYSNSSIITIVPMFIEKHVILPSNCRTELWITSSLSSKEMIESGSPFFKPLICNNSCYKNLLKEEIISLTGFEGWERSWFSLLIKESFGICTDNLSKRNTILVFDDPLKKSCKLDFANSIKMKTISGSQLLDSFKRGYFEEELAVNGIPSDAIIEKKPCNLPLDGCLVSLSQFLYDKRIVLENLISSLGGSFLLRWDKSSTHFITEGSVGSGSGGGGEREIQEAIRHGTKICCPSWLSMMEERNERIEEFGPSIKSNQQSMPSIDYTSLIEEDKKRQKKSKTIEYDLKTTATTTMPTSIPEIARKEERKKVIFANNSRQSKALRKNNVLFLYSLGIDVAMDDSFDSGEVECGTEGIGTDVTHLVVCVNDRLIASEKLLSAIAKGMWVLQYNWITDSIKEEKVMDEEPYQWSNNAIGLKAIEWREMLARSEEYFENSNTNTIRKGRFYGWKVLLLRKSDNPSPKEINQTDIACRVMKLGGAIIIEMDDDDVAVDNNTITHVAYAFDKNLLNNHSYGDDVVVFSISDFQSYLL